MALSRSPSARLAASSARRRAVFAASRSRVACASAASAQRVAARAASRSVCAALRSAASASVLLQALHHDPVEIAAGQPAISRGRPSEPCAPPAVVSARRPSSVLSRVDGRGGSLADRLPHRVEARRHQFRSNGVLAGEQFVEQHAQAVDVAAGVDVQAAHLGLLRAHVGRRADELVRTA
jgi:hypothetical protein